MAGSSCPGRRHSQRNSDAQPGATATEIIASYDKINVLRFVASEGKANKGKRIPLLISYALVNRYTVADLQSGKSLVQQLLANGLDVYVIDLGLPQPRRPLPRPGRLRQTPSSTSPSTLCARIAARAK